MCLLIFAWCGEELLFNHNRDSINDKMILVFSSSSAPIYAYVNEI